MREVAWTNKRLLSLTTLALVITLGVATFASRSLVKGGENRLSARSVERPNSGTSAPLEELINIGLKTYRNEELGFEFSYPEEVPIESISTGTPVYPELLLHFEFGGGLFNEEVFEVELTDARDIEHYTEPAQDHLEELGIKEQHYIILGGEKARVTTFTGDENYTRVQTIHDGKLFSFMTSPWNNEPGPNLTEAILSTFKFLK